MPATNRNLKRSHAIKISVTPAVFEKLQFVSETLGITTAQICAMAVSEYVTTKAISYTSAQATSERAIEAMVPHMVELFQRIGEEEKKC